MSDECLRCGTNHIFGFCQFDPGGIYAPKIDKAEHEKQLAAERAKVAELERGLAKAKEDVAHSFLQGFAVPIAALIRDRDEPTIAFGIMSDNGITVAELKAALVSEFDLRPIQKAARKERG